MTGGLLVRCWTRLSRQGSDILISLIYRLGFGTANVANYGFASAITVLLFLFVGIMVFFQTRSTKAFKEDTL